MNHIPNFCIIIGANGTRKKERFRQAAVRALQEDLGNMNKQELVVQGNNIRYATVSGTSRLIQHTRYE